MRKVANIKANSSAFAPEYDATSEYAFGKFVWHNGIIYQCDKANGQTDPHEPTGGDSDEFWHVAKLDDFFTNSNSLLAGTIKANAVCDDEKTLAVFSTFARMDDFTTVSDESDSFDIAITKLSQLLGENVAA